MSSEILRLVDPRTGPPPTRAGCARWRRRAGSLRGILYHLHAAAGPGCCVKVVFPLPGGSATVLLRPENRPDGAFALVSSGRRFGDVGYYRLHYRDGHTARVKYVPIKETIHVYRGPDGTLRTIMSSTSGVCIS
jgi:hypothetical protein